eukprot:scaffold4672_cov72-Skeletonema_marinoi.AAC.2
MAILRANSAEEKTKPSGLALAVRRELILAVVVSVASGCFYGIIVACTKALLSSRCSCDATDNKDHNVREAAATQDGHHNNDVNLVAAATTEGGHSYSYNIREAAAAKAGHHNNDANLVAASTTGDGHSYNIREAAAAQDGHHHHNNDENLVAAPAAGTLLRLSGGKQVFFSLSLASSDTIKNVKTKIQNRAGKFRLVCNEALLYLVLRLRGGHNNSNNDNLVAAATNGDGHNHNFHEAAAAAARDGDGDGRIASSLRYQIETVMLPSTTILYCHVPYFFNLFVEVLIRWTLVVATSRMISFTRIEFSMAMVWVSQSTAYCTPTNLPSFVQTPEIVTVTLLFKT